jgi:hypothetical protein
MRDGRQAGKAKKVKSDFVKSLAEIDLMDIDIKPSKM